MKSNLNLKKKRFDSLKPWFLSCLFLFTTTSCSDVKFSSPVSSDDPSDLGGPNDPNNPNNPGGNDRNLSDALNMQYDLFTGLNDGGVWVVSKKPPGSAFDKAHFISLNKEQGYPMKSWSLNTALGYGNRTFVSELGLLIGQIGGHVLLVNPNSPETEPAKQIWMAQNPKSDTRPCVTSFKVAEASYVGVAWRNSNNQRVFTRIPILANPAPGENPLNNDAAESKTFPSTSENWGYSCFIDQKRGWFWSAYHKNAPFGVDVKTLEAVPRSSAPNAGHTNSELGTLFSDPAGSGPWSYAFTGDIQGNLLSGSGQYTFSNEPLSEITYVSKQGGSSFVYAPQECFSSRGSCPGEVKTVYTGSTFGSIGPLSSLNDGRVAGIVRGGTSEVILISPSTAAPYDWSTLDLDFERIKSIPGNAYMYTDFTGASSYAKSPQITMDFTKIEGFDPALGIKAIELIWHAQGVGAQEWKGLRISARCYLGNQVSKPAYEPMTTPPASESRFEVQVPSCKNNPTVTAMDIQVEGADAGSDFTRTQSIDVYVFQ